MSEFVDFLWNPDLTEGCQTPVECLASRNRARREVESKRWKPFPYELDSDMDTITEKMRVCRACKTAMGDALKSGRRKLTESIPKIFGLPDWKTLDTMKVSALT
ncbi:hypothetical protein B0H11DRAFT_351823 [Mycena galericulata]|nr:hypothetical protein B0H11DRAFT_351823 [Mycena galericulata]